MNNKSDQWQEYIGSVWASLLSSHTFDCSGCMVEIGPGFTDKIGRGLAKLHFQGTLYIVEPNKAALDWVVNRYRNLLPNAIIIDVNKSIQDACSFLPKDVEAILMNHVLDDMILSAGLSPEEQQIIFSQIRPGESCLSMVKDTWKRLLNDTKYLSTLKQNILDQLDILVKHTNARIVGMSQYKSWFLFANELIDADLTGSKLLLEIILQLGHMSVKDQDILRSVDQNPKDWLFIERKIHAAFPNSKSHDKPYAIRN